MPSLDVANSRLTSYPDRSTGVAVLSAVGRGAWPSAATHQAAGSVKDSHDHAIRSCPSVERRAKYDEHRAHRRDLHRGQRLPTGVEGAHLLRPAVHVHHPDGLVSHREVLDDHIAGRHDLVGAGDRGTIGHRQAEHLAVRGVPAGKQVQRVRAEYGIHALVGDGGHLPPRAIGILAPEEDLPLTTITLLHPVHHPAPVGRGGQKVLRDPLVGEAAGEVNVVRCAVQLAEPHLLPEARGISAQGVPEPRAVVTPGH